MSVVAASAGPADSTADTLPQFALTLGTRSLEAGVQQMADY